jgi:vacuolar-type H+-ATPase subunit H
MSLERILETIEAEAQAQIKKIIAESEAKAAEIKAAALKEAEEAAESYLKEARRQAELEAGRRVTHARLQRKLQLLACKKELIDEVLDKAFVQGIHKGKITLTRTVVFKQEEKEEAWDPEMLKKELRPRLENFIAELLKL